VAIAQLSGITELGRQGIAGSVDSRSHMPADYLPKSSCVKDRNQLVLLSAKAKNREPLS